MPAVCISTGKRGRPRVRVVCADCGEPMSAQELHRHRKECDEARWNRIFEALIDPDYYAIEERSPVPSTLSQTWRVAA